ncbi:MAG: UDP-N-acetylmuramate dehydrogenase [Chloroflexia bacterium]|nr:UDP-N-acetylmuramate dehydrogenase [Chloroflexia bacterium]
MDNPDITLSENVLLAPLTAWRIGGSARYLATVRSARGVQLALEFAERNHLPVWVLGGGSNMLVSDAGLAGLVIRMRDMRVDINVRGDEAIVALGAGAPMAGTVRQLVNAGWAGLAWAEGLPGTLGGAVYGNAGCYGGDMAQSVTQVTVWQAGAVVTYPADQMGFGYRTSLLKQQNASKMRHGMNVADVGSIVVGATVALQRGDAAQLSAEMAATAALRRSKTPAGSSCGSVFKNPPGDSAGRLIDAAGLRGFASGGAVIAVKHANYIINRDHATSSDVLRLIDHVRDEVARQFAIQLEPEVQFLGTAL